MKPVVIRQGRVIIRFPIEKLPTINKEVNGIAADQLMKRLRRMLRKNPSIVALEEFAMIFQDKFPHKRDEYAEILDQAMKNR